MRAVVVVPTTLCLLVGSAHSANHSATVHWYPYTTEHWASKVEGKAAICKDGSEQSPIDFYPCANPPVRTAPTITWKTQKVELINNGHTVQINAKDAAPGGMTYQISGFTMAYTLVQCHFHWPSEHTIAMQQEVFEAHCVHSVDGQNKGNRYGVFGVFYELGDTKNEFLGLFEDQLTTHSLSKTKRRMESSNFSFDLYGNPLDVVTKRRLAQTPSKSSYVGPLDFKKLYQGVRLTKYWNYRGSFTTPPCTEAVDFYIFMTKAVMKQDQLNKFKNAIGWKMAGGNFRQPQALNARTIYGCSAQPPELQWYPYNADTWARAVGSKANTICNGGTEQSPIDFPACASPMTRTAPTITWKQQTVQLVNNGYTVQITATDPAPGGMSYQIGGGTKAYTLVQCHFHWPAEHFIAGTQPVFEAHCVHTDDDVKTPQRYGVFGIFYTVGSTKNEFLGFFEDELTTHPLSATKRRLESSNISFDLYGNPLDAVTKRRLYQAPTKSNYVGPLDFKKLYKSVPLTKYWNYRGSFTTPPCTEAVDFYIFTTKAVMTQGQLDKFKNAIGWRTAGGNFRPPQALNTRTIYGCSTEPPKQWYPYKVDNWATGVGAKANQICKSGIEQSPIDFPACASPLTRTAPNITWKQQTVELINNGYTVQINAKDSAPGGMSYQIGGATKAYTLAQCHFHWPAEHTIAGKQPVFEAHCVHTIDGPSNGRRYGVFGIFYEVGNTKNEFLGIFEDKLPGHTLSATKRRMESSNISFDLYGNPLDAVTKRRLYQAAAMSSYVGPLDFKKLYKGVPLTKYWNYRGSFTTPPCTEAVDFYIFVTKAVMTQGQLDKFKNAIGWKKAGGNFRPPQALNSRTIYGCTAEPPIVKKWYPYDATKWATEVGSKSNKLCKDGKAQSPVNFEGCRSPLERTPVGITWPKQMVELTNNGYTVQIEAKGAQPGWMSANGKIYKLVQCHFHWPSEHTVTTATPAFELHCVHAEDGGKRYGVLGLLYGVSGTKNPALEEFEDKLPLQPIRRLASVSSGWAFDIHGNPLDAKTERRLASIKTTSSWKGPFDFQKMFDIGRPLTHYWSYEGSFTTPPCTEAVDFYILMEQASMTQQQLDKFKKAIGWGAEGGNYRPPQPLSGRTVRGCTVAQIGDSKEEVDAAAQPGLTLLLPLLLLAPLLRQ